MRQMEPSLPAAVTARRTQQQCGLAQHRIDGCAHDDAPAHWPSNDLPGGYEHRNPGAGSCKRRPGLTGRNRPGTPRLALCAALPIGRAFLILGVIRPAIVATHIRRSRHSLLVARPHTTCRHLFHTASQEVLIPAHRVVVSCHSSARPSHRKQGGRLIRGHR